jgi:hypothetical protein
MKYAFASDDWNDIQKLHYWLDQFASNLDSCEVEVEDWELELSHVIEHEKFYEGNEEVEFGDAEIYRYALEYLERKYPVS